MEEEQVRGRGEKEWDGGHGAGNGSASLLHIKPHNGPTFAVAANLSTGCVQDLKSEILGQTGIPVEQQRLLFQGKHLRKENAMLGDYGLTDGSTVLLLQGLLRQKDKENGEKELLDEEVYSVEEESLLKSFFRALWMDESLKAGLKKSWEVTESWWMRFIFPVIQFFFTAVWVVASSYITFAFNLVKFGVELFILTPIHFLITLGMNLTIFAVGFFLATSFAVLNFLFIELPTLWIQLFTGMAWGLFVEWPRKLGHFFADRLLPESLKHLLEDAFTEVMVLLRQLKSFLWACARKAVSFCARLAWRVYPQKGRTIDNYTLAIIPGKRKQLGDKMVYLMQPGQAFEVYIYNDHNYPVKCLLTVDGTSAGVFKMSPFGGYTIRKSAKVLDNGSRLFIFPAEGRKKGEGSNQRAINGSRHNLGQDRVTVKAKFFPVDTKREDHPQVVKVGLVADNHLFRQQ